MIERKTFRALAVLGLCLFAAGAAAQTTEEVRQKFDQGEFLEAADLGEAVGTSESLALAAGALGVYGHYVADKSARLPVLERGVELARRAVEADTTNFEAYHQSAHVVGRYAENIGKMKAVREGVAADIRDFLEAAIRLNPDYADAHVALGGWHAEVARNRIARWMYGGGKEEALYHLSRALELAPDEKVVLYEYGVRIQQLDSDNGQARARELLTRAKEIPAKNAYEEFLHQDVLTALAALDK
ncbi:MAG: hypothetical protein OXM02_01740 [Bacteroidota bacterium]|nr:hypothetical protein [Bacteroidota bacterium]MDE2833227.1 hypothetical protein [Bacteroidota bacterium]MDE2955841.1 hypothetical protein [Bacteroidota bacterium]